MMALQKQTELSSLLGERLKTVASYSGAHSLFHLIENLFALQIFKSHRENYLTKYIDQRAGKGWLTRVSHWQVKATWFKFGKNQYLIILLEDLDFSRWREIGKCDWALQLCRKRGRRSSSKFLWLGGLALQPVSCTDQLHDYAQLHENNKTGMTFVPWILYVKNLLSTLYVLFHLGFGSTF